MLSRYIDCARRYLKKNNESEALKKSDVDNIQLEIVGTAWNMLRSVDFDCFARWITKFRKFLVFIEVERFLYYRDLSEPLFSEQLTVR